MRMSKPPVTLEHRDGDWCVWTTNTGCTICTHPGTGPSTTAASFGPRRTQPHTRRVLAEVYGHNAHVEALNAAGYAPKGGDCNA